MDLVAPTWPEFSGAVRGFVTEAPAALGQPFEVMVPDFSSDRSYEIRRWAARGLTLPALGDEVLVIEDEDKLPWVPVWWPAGGDVALQPYAAPVPADAPVRLVRAATTAALATNTAPTATTLEASVNGALAAQDGVSLAVGDRLLVKNEEAGAKNGIYVVTSLGSAGSKWSLTRLASLNESAELVPGLKVAAAEGTQNGGVTFSLLTTGAITLGSTALTFGYAGGWQAATLLNSWANYEAGYGKAEFRKGPDNKVQLRGLVKHLVASSPAIMQLPEGFRPVGSFTHIFLCMGIVAASAVSGWRVDIATNGEVVPSVGAANTEYLSLSGISFYAD